MPTINRPRPHYPIPIICTECEKAIAGEYFFFHKRIICQICFQQKCRTKIDHFFISPIPGVRDEKTEKKEFVRELHDPIFQTKETYHKADFVVVTDMDYGFAEKVKQTFLDLKHEKKISTYCIIVDPRMAALDLRSHCISPICDTMVAVDELTDQTAGDLFEAI
jgi:hypothetical protein